MTELDRLRRDCAIAGKTWNRSFSALLLSTLRSHGGAVLDRLWAALLLSHQDMYFVSSLQKLGIASDPPAVAAAKYHYFSNSLGGQKSACSRRTVIMPASVSGDRKSTRLNSSHPRLSRMPSSA